jgi:hypothetical protein
MKTKIIAIILVAIGLGFAITLVSGLYLQTILPSNLSSGTTKTWGGFPFGWWGYSQVGHVYLFNPPHWFSLVSFVSDIAVWFLIISCSAFATLRFLRTKEKRQINSILN